jgi:para-nitrobenzyl esterase
MTGNGPERAELAEKMSGAFAAFARTGNPNHSAIPRWDAWTPDRFQTMVFDREIKAENDPFGEIRRTVAALRVRRGAS